MTTKQSMMTTIGSRHAPIQAWSANKPCHNHHQNHTHMQQHHQSPRCHNAPTTPTTSQSNQTSQRNQTHQPNTYLQNNISFNCNRSVMEHLCHLLPTTHKHTSHPIQQHPQTN